MIERILPKIIREVLVKLQKTDYIITGSYALDYYGLLDRAPKDLDLLSNDPKVISILKEICVDMSDVFEKITHKRFIYFSKGQEVYIDVFPTQSDIEFFITEDSYKISKMEDIYLTKLLKYPTLKKSREDLISYFKHHS